MGQYPAVAHHAGRPAEQLRLQYGPAMREGQGDELAEIPPACVPVQQLLPL